MKPKTVATAVLTLLISGCANTGSQAPSVTNMLKEATGQNGRACVRKSHIQGYGVLKHSLISIDGLRNYYLATVLPGCMDLQSSIGVIFSGNFYEICGQSMDRVVARDTQCTIGHIYEFENREQAFATYNAVLERRQALKEESEAE